jgi:hypothetical protein
MIKNNVMPGDQDAIHVVSLCRRPARAHSNMSNNDVMGVDVERGVEVATVTVCDLNTVAGRRLAGYR